jgi:DNA-binding CsgD family transcriptional regulator
MGYSREILGGFSRAVLALAGGGRAEEIALRFMPHLERLFSAHMSAINVLEDGVPVPRIVAAHTLDLSHFTVTEFPRYAMEHPGVRFLASGGRAPVLRISDFITDRQFRETGLYREIFRHFGGEQQMTLMVAIPGEQWAFVLFRDRAFTDDEVHLLTQFEPHVAQALAAAKGLKGGAAAVDGWSAGAQGLIVLDIEGRPHHANEAAGRLLVKYFGVAGASAGGTGRLPEDLARWVGVSVRMLRALGLTSVPGRNLVVPAVAGVLEANLVIDMVTGAPFLQLRERAAGFDYGGLIRVGLTKRECEVLFWVAQGKRDAEIAVVLGAATKTVGKHVENILDKLGVETRTAAVRVAGELLRAVG